MGPDTKEGEGVGGGIPLPRQGPFFFWTLKTVFGGPFLSSGYQNRFLLHHKLNTNSS